MPRTSRTRPQPEREETWSIPSLREPRYSQSLERGLAILRSFTPQRPVLGIADIAEELGMSRSTTHRYVITLVALGYLEQRSDRKYRLGLRVTDLGMSALNATGLSEHARPYLEELARRTSYATAIAVLDGTEMLMVDRLPSLRRGESELQANLHAGSRLPAWCTAIGKLLLAHLPDGERQQTLRQIKLSRRGPNAVGTKRALATELAQIREEGLATDDQELARDLYAVAAPVRGSGEEVLAGVSLSAPAQAISLEEMVSALGPHLIAAADSISARLGHRRKDERG